MDFLLLFLFMDLQILSLPLVCLSHLLKFPFPLFTPPFELIVVVGKVISVSSFGLGILLCIDFVLIIIILLALLMYLGHD